MGNSIFMPKKKKRTVVFMGAGISYSSGVITADRLKKKVWEKMGFQGYEREEIQRDLIDNGDAGIREFADYLEDCSPSKRLLFKEEIARELYAPSPVISPDYRMLAFLIKKRRINAIFTTNQDGCLERALETQGILYNLFVYPYSGAVLQTNANAAVDIYKLCGDLHSPYEMCFSERELEACTRSPLFRKFTDCFQDNCDIVFIGYSACNDPVADALRSASGQRKRNDSATVYCVDLKRQEGHKALVREEIGDVFIESTAEDYLLQEIRAIQPEIIVKHALISNNGFGGIQTYAYSLMRLQERFRVKVKASAFATREFAKDGKCLGFSYDLAAAKAETARVLASERPDLIHSHYFVCAYTAEMLNSPCVFTSHSMESTEMIVYERKAALAGADDRNDPFSRDSAKYEQRYYRQLSNILALSEAHIREMPADVQHGVKKIAAPFLLPGSLEGEHRVETNISPREQREKLYDRDIYPYNIADGGRMKKEPVTISFFGRPDRRKGLHIFHEVVKLLAKEQLEFQAMYVGPRLRLKDGKITVESENSSYDQRYYELFEMEQEVEKDVQQYMYVAPGTDDTVDLPSFEAHLKKLYSLYLASDIVVMPSSYETFGYVALEAMACGRPVVARRIAGLEYLLGEDRGFLVDENGDDGSIAEAMAGEIRELICNRDTAPVKERVARAKAWVEAVYSNEKMERLAQEMYEIYLDAIVQGKYKSDRDKETYENVKNVMKASIGWTEEWTNLLTQSAKAYMELLRRVDPGRTGYREIYELFWSMAYWLKVNKSVCNEIRMMPLRELAELLTEVVRFRWNQ